MKIKSIFFRRATACSSRLKWQALPLLAVMTFSVPASAFYKCTDTNGRVTYQQHVCNEVDVEKKLHIYNPPEIGVSKDKAYVGDKSSPLLRAQLASILASLSPIKLRVIEHYRYMGVWPETLESIGLVAAEVASSNVEKVTFDEDGGIHAYLRETFGDNKRVVIRPKSVMGGTSFEWECFANFNKATLLYLGNPSCESREIY